MTSAFRRRKRSSGSADNTGSTTSTAPRRKIKTNARALRSLGLITPEMGRSIQGDVERVDGPDGAYSAFYMQTGRGPTVVVATDAAPNDALAQQVAADIADYYRDGDPTGARAPERLMVVSTEGDPDSAANVMSRVARTLNGLAEDRRYAFDADGAEQLDGGASGFLFRIQEAVLRGPIPDDDALGDQAERDGGGPENRDDARPRLVRRNARAHLGLPARHPDADLAVDVDRVALTTVSELEAEAGKANRLRTADYRSLVSKLGKYHKRVDDFRADVQARQEAIKPIGKERAEAVASLTETHGELNTQRRMVIGLDSQVRQLEGVLDGLRRELPNATEERTREIETRIDTEIRHLEGSLRPGLLRARDEVERLVAKSQDDFRRVRRIEDELARRAADDRAALRRAQQTLQDDADGLRDAAQTWLADRETSRTDKKYAAVQIVVAQVTAKGQHLERLKQATEEVWGAPFRALPAEPITLLNTGTASEVFAVRTNGPIGESDTVEGFAKRALGIGSAVNDTMVNLGYNPTGGSMTEDPHLIARQVVSSRVARLLETPVIADEIFSVGSDGELIGITARADGTQFQRSEAVEMQQFPDAGDAAGGPVANTVNRIARIDLENNGAAQRNLSMLQLVDALTGQMDRHLGNIFIDPQSGAVTGIDNDMAFPRPVRREDGSLSDDAFRTVNGPTVFDRVNGQWVFLQDQVDRGLAERILADGFEEEFRQLIEGEQNDPEHLVELEVEGAMARLAAIKTKLADLRDNGRLLGPDDWGPDTYRTAVDQGKRRVEFNNNDQEMNFVIRMDEAMERAAGGTDPRTLQAE